MKTIYHFSGAGNDFVVIDGREGNVSAFREVPRIEALCKQYKTDGLMILGSALRQAQGPEVDFTMEFYNPDGSGGMMCAASWRLPIIWASSRLPAVYFCSWRRTGYIPARFSNGPRTAFGPYVSR